MKELLLNIENLFKQHLNSIIHIDYWNEQLANIEDEAPFLRPALFVEFGIVQWYRQEKTKKTGTVPVVFHLVTDNYDIYADRNDTLDSLDLLGAAENLLDNNVIPGSTPFLHQGSETDHNHGNLIHHMLTYQFDYTKCIPDRRNLIDVNAGLNVEGKIKK